MRESGEGRGREDLIRQDVLDLHRLGYAPQRFREMGGFSNFAISFSIISVLTGAVLLFGYGLKLAGPIVNSVGWPVVSLFTLAVAASMAELASAYPTAGGLYFWAHRLGGRGWGWVTAWLNMLGQVTITAGIDVAAAIYLVGAVCRILGISPDLPLPLVGSLGSWSCSLVVMVLIMVPQVLINALGIRLTARLNDLSVWWHVGGVSLLVLLLGVFGRIHHPLAFAFSAVNTVNPLDASSATFADGTAGPALTVGSLVLPSPLFALVPGLVAFYRSAPIPFVFALALLQAQWTYTGYDASVHVAEETVMARLNSAWGVFLWVAVSAVVGYAMLLAPTRFPCTSTGGTAVAARASTRAARTRPGRSGDGARRSTSSRSSGSASSPSSSSSRRTSSSSGRCSWSPRDSSSIGDSTRASASRVPRPPTSRSPVASRLPSCAAAAERQVRRGTPVAR